MRDGINDFDPLLLSLTGLLHPATDLLLISHTVLGLESRDLLRVWRGGDDLSGGGGCLETLDVYPATRS